MYPRATIKMPKHFCVAWWWLTMPDDDRLNFIIKFCK